MGKSLPQFRIQKTLKATGKKPREKIHEIIRFVVCCKPQSKLDKQHENVAKKRNIYRKRERSKCSKRAEEKTMSHMSKLSQNDTNAVRIAH